jgi:purine-binding chemotaxis protein CheW
MKDEMMDKVATIDDTQQVLAVYLGAEMFGIPITHVQGVLETLPLTYVPLAPAAVRGVMNLRGRIVTAIDLRTTLSGEDKVLIGGPQANMSIVIEEDGELYSLLVDTVGDVHTLSVAHIEEPPLTMAESLKKVSSGVFALRDKIMVILKPSALLNRDGEE